MSTRTKPDGGALAGIVEKFIATAKTEAKAEGQTTESVIRKKLDHHTELVNGYDFADVIAAYCRGFEEGTLMRHFMLWWAGRHRRTQLADPALRSALTPDYPLGCKRIIYSNDYYPALCQPHVSLVTEGIERITPRGIRTIDGEEHPVDVLVCATGFDTLRPLSSVSVTGLQGRTLREAWAQGAEAYHGVTVAGFPNLFLMLGPNTGTGHTSTLLFIEPEVQHAIACMRRVKHQNKRWIDVRADVMAAHNQQLQQRLAGSVWTQCRSWYRMEGGRVVALFPGFTAEYVRAVRHPAAQDYTLG